MIVYSVFIRFVVVFLAVSHLVFGAFALEESDEFELEIRIEKDEYLIAEPLQIFFKLRNAGEKKLEFSSEFSFNGSLSVQYKHSDDRRYRLYRPAFVADFASSGSKKILPLDGLEVVYKLYFDANYVANDSEHSLLDRPGDYKLYASFWPLNGVEVVSDLIEFSVVEPSGDGLRALELWKDKDVLYLMQGYHSRGNAIESLRKISAEFPDTLYGKLASERIFVFDENEIGKERIEALPSSPPKVEEGSGVSIAKTEDIGGSNKVGFWVIAGAIVFAVLFWMLKSFRKRSKEAGS